MKLRATVIISSLVLLLSAAGCDTNNDEAGGGIETNGPGINDPDTSIGGDTGGGDPDTLMDDATGNPMDDGSGGDPDTATTPDEPTLPTGPGQIWVANRGSKTVTVIDVASNKLLDSISMPNDGEPMYVNYSGWGDVVFVGDRANDRVVAFNRMTHEPIRMIATGKGVFHQWALPKGTQLWVNNDVDRTTTVIDTKTYEPIGQIEMPHDLAAMPGVDGAVPKPHDVLIDPSGDFAYVSYLGFAGGADYVVRFDAHTLKETHRAPVGKDPHLSATADNDVLYVPCQETDEVVVLQRADLSEVKRLPIPGAHGAGMAANGDHLYITNLPDGGDMALFVIDTATNALVSEAGVPAPMVGKPHNVAVSGDDSLVYVTHSGPDADLVSVYPISAAAPVPAGVSAQIEVGKNPFGLGFVPGPAAPMSEARHRVFFDVSELATLRDGHHYEGWAIIDSAPVSTGKFNVDASGVATDLDGIAIPDGIFDGGRDLTVAEAFVLTIEEPGDKDIVPNDTHILAGDLVGYGATLKIGHPGALGTSFKEATGNYILATPTDDDDTNEMSGVWWLSLQMTTPKPGLSLPVLPEGWTYEGWAVVDGTPVSTGTFLAVDASDDAAPHSGMNDGPAVPGEDLLVNAPAGLSFPTNLSGATVVISIEPLPDDSADPFQLKPLVGMVPENANDHQTFDMMNNASTAPIVTAMLKE